MEIIIEFETKGSLVIINFLEKIKLKSNKNEKLKINKIIRLIKENSTRILNNFNTLKFKNFDFKIHFNSMINFINTLDKLHIDYRDNEISELIELIKKDYHLYWNNIENLTY